MTAALGTLPFLATLWLLVVLGAAVLEESGAKIAAALKCKSRELPLPRHARGRHARPMLTARLKLANVQWRAAA